MTTESAILETVRKLPECIKQAVLLYTEFLESRYEEDTEAGRKNSDSATLVQPSLFGSMKGTFALPLSDDFDEPLEDFQEYV